MKRMLAGVMALGAIGYAAGLGAGVSAADDANGATARSSVGRSSTARVVYAVGGARAPDIPWYDYTERAGDAYYPGARRTIVDYPAAAAFNWLPDMFLPAGGREGGSIGQAVDVAARHLDADIRGGTRPAAAVGLSEGALGLDQERMRLAGDPAAAPPPGALSFSEFGDPTGRNAFGASMLAHIFGPGSYIPVIDYTMPKAVDSQYDDNEVVTAYDGLSDFPDRPDNLVSLANAAAGAALVHTLTAFTSPGDVPSTNIRTAVNPKGGTTSPYLVPIDDLPLDSAAVPRGPDGFVDQIDSVLQPMADAGYVRNDNPVTKPVSVDPVHGMDPVALLDPSTRDSFIRTFSTIRGMIPSIG